MIFVDTWAWIGLAVKKDQYHSQIQAQHARFRKARTEYVTTDYVLTELITYLYNVGPVATAEAFVRSLLGAIDASRYRLIQLSHEQFHRAWLLRVKYRDKPDISFVDFTSMIVMQDLGITDVFTGDAHFRQVGLGFRLIP
jgi:predicted nucleic acid-binding protein